uniref:Putative inner membrane protein n=1 Tax=Bradyrhizobium japonicum TaxID=375 RepID=Q8GNI5_BRAJP|nr:putative inner membrane protein [Bradyrhizobium japonicum]
MTRCRLPAAPDALVAFGPARRLGSSCRTSCCVSSMASAPNPGPSATTAVLASVAALGIWRLLAVAAPASGGALALMYETETDFRARALSFALAWGGISNFLSGSRCCARAGAVGAALSLTLVVVLVLLSRGSKHDVVQMTVNFIDLMMIRPATTVRRFPVHEFFPNLRWSVILAGLVTLPLMYALWWLDSVPHPPLPALACKLACLAALVGYSLYHPDEAWRGYYDDGYLSKFFRSGVSAVSDFAQYGFMESAASTNERLNMPLVDACHLRPPAEHHHDP